MVSCCHFPRHNDKLALPLVRSKTVWNLLFAHRWVLSFNLKQSSVSVTSSHFTWGSGSAGKRKYTDNEQWVMVICKTMNIEDTWNNN